MALSNNERSPHLLNTINDAIKSALAVLWTNLPCIVEEYDPDKQTVSVISAIKIPVMLEDGSMKHEEITKIPDVPVCWPKAGGFALTFPVKRGDECLVHFSSRCIDLWWQNGGIQPPFENRKHDLSDGFATFAPQSQLRRLKNVATDAVELRNDAGNAKIRINDAGELEFLGTKATFNCPVEMKDGLGVVGALKNNDVDVGSSHGHTKVQPGSGESGPPKP
ncbi:Gp138 family membrane-puncturing spike protein [Acinetobacter baumannii]|uniref:Gp138 family membrane-puncturing spike protein n=1 Tax=Acinetobacter baumannii TaxID=470 RepID=UPI00244CE002|nr:Gp138 family membrane-puncturing spike protein [Acinetobacter baumannii]MDH2480852.1 Gp138 family membrane-puncturing spike protein [Acinetobacter baumannii]MDH2501911.1 Gp138 family membrane-puncturing spike protein [Acinetobacter baumannii]